MWRSRLVCAQCCWLFASSVCGAQLHPAWVLWALLPSSISAVAVTGAWAAGPAGCAIGGGLAGILHLTSLFERMQHDHEAHHRHSASARPMHYQSPPTPLRRFERVVDFAQMREFLNAREFRLRFGLSCEAFDYVLGLIKDDITDTPGGWGGIRNSEILPPEVKLAVTLQWLRGAQYHQLFYEWGMSRATFYRTWRRVCLAILKQPALVLKLMPAIEAWRQGDFRPLAELATGFGRFTNGVFQFCIGAVDGVQVARAPPAAAAACRSSEPRALPPRPPPGPFPLLPLVAHAC